MDFLSSNYVETLKTCSTNISITDEVFQSLVKFSLDTILTNIENPPKQLDSVEPVLLKQLHAAFITLFLESARGDIQNDQLDLVLDDCNFSSSAKEYYISLYSENRSDLRNHLGTIGLGFPHIADVDWRLNYNLKNSHIHKVNELRYMISLSATNGEEIKFTCSKEELQDLFGKLKEAAKAVERATQV